MIGCLLLTLGVLTLLAPPVESHDNPTNAQGTPEVAHALISGPEIAIKHAEHPGVQHDITITAFFGGNLTAIHPKHFDIQWIRVYKNPAIMELDDLEADRGVFNRTGTPVAYVVTPPDFEYRRARLFPSLRADLEALKNGTPKLEDERHKFFWVKIEPGGGPSDPTSGGLLPDDENHPGNTGRVTATENTTVVPGDRVAIAINVKLTYYEAKYGYLNHRTKLFMSEPRRGPWIAPNLSTDSARPRYPGAATHPRAENLLLHLPYFFKEGQRGIDSGHVWASNIGFVISGPSSANEYRYVPVAVEHDRRNKLAGGAIIAAMHLPEVGILNPNYPLENAITTARPIVHNEIDRSLTHTDLGHRNMDGYHTLVYQFKVTADHLGLNNEGEWLKRRDDGNVNPFNMPYDGKNADYAFSTFTGKPWSERSESEKHGQRFGFWVPFGDKNVDDTGWDGRGSNPLHQFLDPADFMKKSYTMAYRAHESQPAGTATYGKELFDSNSDGLMDYLLPIDGNEMTMDPRHYMVRAEFYNDKGDDFHHYLPPTYDGRQGAIHYPRIVAAYVAATPTLEPPGTQTGPFMVTLRFQEHYGDLQNAPSHDTSDEGLAALRAALVAGVEHGTVTGLSRLSVADASTRYQVTLEPELGFVGELTLQVPADTVVALNSNLGNLAATLTVPIDTSLQLVSGQSVEVVEPESGTYLSGDEIVVRVPFAADGLTYEGDNPPYVTIYLGEQGAATARHATWQKGEEQSGSTIVPFVYVLQASDPPAATVTVDLNSLSIPRETTLMAASGLERAGTDEPAVAPGEAAPVPDTSAAPMISITDSSGERQETVTVDAPVTPVIYLPQDDTVSKAVASTVPRSPVVFNELGNGSEAANDWLEFRNVSGSDVSLKDWELSVVVDGKKEDTSLIVFPDVSVPANGLLLITNSAADKTPLAGGENRGLSHASLVDAGLSLPDDGKFLLILRNAKEKLGLDEAFIDVAGGGGSDTDAFVRDETGDYDTYVWPLQVLEAPGDATEDALSAGKVWQRAKADIIGYHQAAWAEAAFTGIGYDRKVTRSAATAGTPGYPNGAAKTAASTPKGAVTISEIMFDSDRGKLPQWIELYNKSKTEALNLDRWQLEIQNRNSEDLIGRPIVTLTLQEKVIQPNQTLLIVAGNARASSADVFPADRVYNLLELHEKNLRIKTPRDTFLSGEGFYLKLSDRNGTKIDEVGNIDDNRRTDDAPVWVWPTNRREGPRSSVVRRYDKGSDARDGMLKSNWALSANFNQFKVESLHYGHADDIGTPGYRKGGALPVELSSFKVTRTDEGPVIVTWTTESEVDNAGFNLRRSLTRDSGFTLLNPVLIAGAGTTGERQTYTFTDTSAKPGVEYYYQIEEVSLGGRPETLRTRRLPGPVSPANRALTTFGEVKQRE